MPHFREKPRFGLTGEMAENELFGEAGQKINIDFKKWLAKRNELYMPKRKAIEAVKENQPGDPREPGPKFASDVYEEVVRRLIELDGKENNPDNYFEAVGRVAFFTAVHSPLDYAHGVDAFFEIDSKADEFVRVELDASTHRKAEFDADVLVEYPSGGLDPKDDKDDWESLVGRTADSILETFNAKIRSHDTNRR